MAKGPLGNHPRDLRDDFVGAPSELYKGGEPPKKSRKPKYVTSNTFHTSVTGETSNKRPDRAGHFRSGGFVRGKADGGTVEGGKPTDREMPSTTSEKYRKGGGVKKKFADGGILDDARMVPLPQIGEAKGRMAPMPQVGPSEGKMVPLPDVRLRGPNIPRTDAEREKIWGLNRKKGGKV